jgi:hypothetical protein
VVDFLAAFRPRCSCTTAASEGGVALLAGLGSAVAVNLTRSVVLPLVPLRRGLTGTLLPVAFSREAIHS